MGGFEIFCATMIALLFGLFVAFGGYRFFLVLLPIWGFFFGFALGAHSMTALFGDAFFATVTSWIVGFVVALLFAVLSYLFYFVAVGLVAASIGYGIGVSIMAFFGIGPNFFSWIVGVVIAVALVVVTYMYNLQKYVVIIGTALIGATVIVGTFLLGVDPGPGGAGVLTIARSMDNPIQTLFSASWFYGILWVAIVIAGAIMQWRVNKNFEIQEYNRWQEATTA